MTLIKLEAYFPNYHTEANGYDITTFEVIAKDDEKIGSVETVLVDREYNRSRYFVVDMGFWVFGQKILIPVGLGLIVDADRSVYVAKFTKDQLKDAPKYDESLINDSRYQAQVNQYYHKLLGTINETQADATFDYQRAPDFYELKDSNLKQYEERFSKQNK